MNQINNQIFNYLLRSVLIMLFAIVFSSCSENKEQEAENSTIPVSIYKVEESDIIIPIKTSGKITAEKEMRLSFKTGGIIERIYVNDGQRVKKGDLLAELDLQEINAQVNQAQSAFNKASRDYNRVQSLYKDSVVTLEQYQNTETALEVAEANLNIANFNKNLSTITAPSNGRIYAKFAEVQEIVAPGTPVFLFGTQNSNWEIEAGLTDKDIKKVRLNDSASVVIDAYPNHPYSAFISEIAGGIDPYSSTYKVVLRIRKPDDKIISGMIASVNIYPKSSGKFKIIPIKSVVNTDNMSGQVYTLNHSDSTVNSVEVNIRDIWNDKIVVEAGLDSVSEVVYDGVEYMFEGAKVKVTKITDSGDAK